MLAFLGGIIWWIVGAAVALLLFLTLGLCLAFVVFDDSGHPNQTGGGGTITHPIPNPSPPLGGQTGAGNQSALPAACQGGTPGLHAQIAIQGQPVVGQKLATTITLCRYGGGALSPVTGLAVAYSTDRQIPTHYVKMDYFGNPVFLDRADHNWFDVGQLDGNAVWQQSGNILVSDDGNPNALLYCLWIQVRHYGAGVVDFNNATWTATGGATNTWSQCYRFAG